LQYPHIAEGVILSTCNRTEVYTVTSEELKGQQEVVDFLCDYSGIKKRKLRPYLYFLSEKGAVHHLFRVVSSLDSMVVGEAQILGQVKEAYEVALEFGATKSIFNRFFRQALSVGKRVRSETAIGESAVSISYAAVQLAKTVFEELAGRLVMIIGAGEMGELTVKHLIDLGVKSVLVTNRTYQRAVDLAKEFGGRAIAFENRFDEMSLVDIVISSTGAPHYIIKREDLIEVMKRRRGRPIFLIDIAVPRDVDPEAEKVYNVFLYDIDDLEAVVEANKKEREREAQLAEEIIDEEVEEFLDWLCTLEVVPTLKELRDWAEKVKEDELAKALSKLSSMSDKDKRVVNTLAHAIVNKLLHQPTVKLKECALRKDGYSYVEALRLLFGLEEEE
jgi:glutamyl-tRNA reductase